MVEVRKLIFIYPVIFNPFFGRDFFSRALNRLVSVGLACVVLALAGCATSGGVAISPDELATTLERANELNKSEAGQEEARSLYEQVAAQLPADKRPWLGLAQSYFDSTDYGNAILAAQEVVQRDPKDEVALGILAISGLRISTESLTALRNQSALDGTTKINAEIMAKNLRSLLGVPVLVPRSEATTSSPAQRRNSPPPRNIKRPATSPKPATSPAAPAETPTANKPANPFGVFN